MKAIFVAAMCANAGAIWQDSCYSMVAEGEKDAKICERVLNSQQKSICIRNAGGK